MATLQWASSEAEPICGVARVEDLAKRGWRQVAEHPLFEKVFLMEEDQETTGADALKGGPSDSENTGNGQCDTPAPAGAGTLE